MNDLTAKPQTTSANPADADKPPPKRAKAPGGKPSIISSDIEIEGDVETSGDVRIDGVINGDVRADTLIVGAAGRIFGEVAAAEVVVDGAVKGRIVGGDVELRSSAQVEGDIAHEVLEVKRGARFEGSVKRVKAAQSPARAPRKEAPQSGTG